MTSKKQIKKKLDKHCYFCKENDYSLLDSHRIVPGQKGGKYTDFNTLTVCANCHRKCHSGRIEILGRYPSTAGRWVLHFKEDNCEKWK
jgi:hypothetical protein